MFVTPVSSSFNVSLSIFTLAWLCASCEARLPEPPSPTSVAMLEGNSLAGLSGLAIDDGGALWAVPERKPALIQLRTTGAVLEPVKVVPIDGAPEGYDLESISYHNGRFYIGTEHLRPDREDDPILVVRVAGKRAKVERTLSFRYAPWGIKASRNHGVEGICATKDYIVGAAEIGLGTTNRRAPVAVLERKSGKLVQAYEVPLTSETGKLSSLECNVRDGSVDLIAVERHYGVARLLVAKLPLDGKSKTAEVGVFADLSTRLNPLPNLEGIARDQNGVFYAVSDNQGRTVSGPTMLFFGKLGEGLFAERGRNE
ncbi:MAG: esterase-like activity of phytase family protein [Myxococcota bacterium]